jgi:sugar lactone lactonase YvrE
MARIKKVFKVLLVLLVAIIAYLLLAPVPIAPVAWTPATTPGLTGQFAMNANLAPVQRLSLGEGHGPEDVALDAEGRIYAGFEDGRIIQLQSDGTQPKVFANTNGRPLGLVFDRQGNLIVADAIKGLLSVDRSGQVKVLATEADGAKFGCLNDLDVGADGTIYFTEASHKFPMSQHIADLMEHQPNGRLLSLRPQESLQSKPQTLLRGIHFANGVAVSPDQSFVLVAETGMYRIMRVWLTGEKQGQAEVFIDNLPGFPDGLSSNGRDKFWIALVTPRQKLFDWLLPRPFLRKVVYRMPKFMQPKPQRYSFVVAVDQNGKVVNNLQNGAPDCYAQIANVVERAGTLYFGSIGEDTVGKFVLR